MDLLNLDWQKLDIQMDQDERCGVITKLGEIIELPNSSTFPNNSYLIYEKDIQGLEIIATWHSHPRGPLNLSIDDYNNFAELSELKHLVLTPRFVALYGMDDGFVMNIGRSQYA